MHITSSFVLLSLLKYKKGYNCFFFCLPILYVVCVTFWVPCEWLDVVLGHSIVHRAFCIIVDRFLSFNNFFSVSSTFVKFFFHQLRFRIFFFLDNREKLIHVLSDLTSKWTWCWSRRTRASWRSCRGSTCGCPASPPSTISRSSSLFAASTPWRAIR